MVYRFLFVLLCINPVFLETRFPGWRSNVGLLVFGIAALKFLSRYVRLISAPVSTSRDSQARVVPTSARDSHAFGFVSEIKVKHQEKAESVAAAVEERGLFEKPYALVDSAGSWINQVLSSATGEVQRFGSGLFRGTMFASNGLPDQAYFSTNRSRSRDPISAIVSSGRDMIRLPALTGRFNFLASNSLPDAAYFPRSS